MKRIGQSISAIVAMLLIVLSFIGAFFSASFSMSTAKAIIIAVFLLSIVSFVIAGAKERRLEEVLQYMPGPHGQQKIPPDPFVSPPRRRWPW